MWTVLCDTLASKLMVVDYTLPVALCYIGAGNIDKAVEIWSKSLSAGLEGKSYVDLLQNPEVLDKVGIKPPHGVLSKGAPGCVDLIHERDVLLDNFCLLEFLSPSCNN
ncbi:protein transport protein SEC31-like protein B [Cucumis melo var. makuwa]|uniref:Protein transport protein SEC31-like protein B n=1 Tax=Cucumis melo var. makuwa TaxID=1194695 RepID=A0A5D3BPT5_CUCMM|nr:protein transport protein SEC31-like protein B [Cucumis melo var. makuwa]